jgi:hypothetical protein
VVRGLEGLEAREHARGDRALVRRQVHVLARWPRRAGQGAGRPPCAPRASLSRRGRDLLGRMMRRAAGGGGRGARTVFGDVEEAAGQALLHRRAVEGGRRVGREHAVPGGAGGGEEGQGVRPARAPQS